MSIKKLIVRSIGLVVALSLVAIVGWLISSSRASPLVRQAEHIVEQCKKYAPAVREGCYVQAVPALYPADSVAQLFAVIAQIQTLDPTYTSCHLTAHAIGARIADDDPAHWTDGVHMSPPGSVCDGGFLHGLLAERFNAEVLSERTIEQLIPVFQHVCDPTASWHPSAFDQYECYHGMGHLYVFATNADMPRVMKLCQETVPALLSDQGPRQCYEGAFMQIISPTGPDGYDLQKNLPIPIATSTVHAFCGIFRGDTMQYGTCLQRSLKFHWPPTATTTVDDLCADEPASEFQPCLVRAFEVLGHDAGEQAASDPSVCDVASPSERDLCYTTVSLTLLRDSSTIESERRAIAFCDGIKDPGSASGCLQSLAGHGAYFYDPRSDSFAAYCALFSGPLHETCMRSAGTAPVAPGAVAPSVY